MASKWDRLARRLLGITKNDIEEIEERSDFVSKRISYAETVENKK